jgi:hypothetical protein
MYHGSFKMFDGVSSADDEDDTGSLETIAVQFAMCVLYCPRIQC